MAADGLDVLAEDDVVRRDRDGQLLLQSLRNIVFCNCSVQLARLGCLAREGDRLAGESRGGLGAHLFFTLFFLGALADLLGVPLADRRGGNQRQPLRKQMIQGKTVPHDQQVVFLPNAGDILEEENFHC